MFAISNVSLHWQNMSNSIGETASGCDYTYNP